MTSVYRCQIESDIGVSQLDCSQVRLPKLMTTVSAPVGFKSVAEFLESPEKDGVWKMAFGRLSETSYFQKVLTQNKGSRSMRRQFQVGKVINLKMRNKLAHWLQEINNETFHFKTATLLNAIQILDEFLAASNEHFSSLQLIGCAALYMSSKINQNIIVAGQYYADCAGGIFDKQDLTRKEKTLFHALGSDINFSNPLRIFNFFLKTLGIEKQFTKKAEQVLSSTYFDQTFAGFSELEIALATLRVALKGDELTCQAILHTLQTEYFF